MCGVEISAGELLFNVFFFVFAYGFELGMWEAVTTGLREKQRASVVVERLVEV